MSKTRLPKTPVGQSGAAHVARAVEAGLIVHIEHPDFGGTITAGYSTRADCDRFTSSIDMGRYVERQVGSRRAYWAAWDRIADAAMEAA